MGRCSKCGKSGFFLIIDAFGLCKDCAIKEAKLQETQLADTSAFLAPISAAFSDLRESGANVPVSSGSWLDTKDVPRVSVQRCREACSLICSELPKWAEYPLFEDVFLAECSRSSQINSCYEHPYINLGPLYKKGDSVSNNFEKKISGLLKNVHSLETALAIYGDYEYKTIRVVGVTFENEDSRKRQEILKKIRYRGAPYTDDPEIRLAKCTYKGSDSVAVYANEEQVGFVSEFDLTYILSRWDRYKDVVRFSLHGDGSRNNKFGMDIEIRIFKSE